MNDISDLGGTSDVDSLASTVESEGASEYVVEDILAEREIFAEPDSENSDDEGEYVTQYLVKWSGYPAHRHTWESEEQFTSEETLQDWRLKKKEIAAGKKKPFNVKDWENHCSKVQKETQRRKEARRREREQRAQQKNNPQALQEDSADDHLDYTSPAPQPTSRGLSMNSDASLDLLIEKEIPPPARKAPCQPAERQKSKKPATPNAQITTTGASEPILSRATKDSYHRQKPSVSKPPARPKKAHNKKPPFAMFGVPSEKHVAAQPSWMEKGPPLSAATAIGLVNLSNSKYVSWTDVGVDTPAKLLSKASPEARRVTHQLAGELQGSIEGAPAASSGETDMAAIQQPNQDMPPPAPYSLNNGRLRPIHSSNGLTEVPPGPTPPQPTQPRAFTRPGRPPGLQTSLDSRGPFSRMSPPSRNRSPRPRPSSPRRASSPCRRVSSPRRRSPPHWSSPPRRSPRRGSPSWRRSPHRRSYSPENTPPPSRRRSSPRRQSPRWPSKPSFPWGGDSWRPDSPPFNCPPSIASKDTGSAKLQDRSIPNNRPNSSTCHKTRTTFQHGITEEPSTEAIAQARIARMPVRRIPEDRPGVTTLSKGYWWDNGQDELLMHVYFGPQKKWIGPLRLCGLDRRVKQTLLREGRRRDSNSYEVWFEHLCTFAEFQRLCLHRTARIEGTAWAEGFANNNSRLFYMAEDLRADDLIAIHYPRREIIEPRYSLIAWSHGSPSFNFRPMSNKELPRDVEIPLLVAVHSMLAEIESLGPRNLNRSKPDPRAHNTPGESLQPPNPARAQNLPVSIGPSSHQVSAKLEPEFQPKILAPHNNESAAKKFDAFMKERNINIETLATIENGGQVFKASFFYLHFPHDPEIQKELDVLSTYLKFRDITVHTNLEQDGWAKFYSNSKRGVVIFHESFNEYGQLRPALGLAVHNHEFAFWVIRLNGPLRLMDDRYCSPGDHCTRIFPKDGMILLTEDMLEKDLRGVAVILQWLRVRFAKKSSNHYHLMLHPGIIEWIKKRLDDESFSKVHGLLGLIHTLIMKSNVTDIRKELFKPSSLDPDSSSLVVSHPIHHYGDRTEHDEPKIMDKTIRDADHLIEFFAGWALLNRQRFRHFIALTSISKSPVTAHWSSWGHINVVHGGHVPFLKHFKIRDSEVDGFWRHLCRKYKTDVTDQPSTPVIADTPGTPSGPIQTTDTSVQSPSQGNDTVQEKDNDPVPSE